jgi:hypothetical protein
MRPVYEPSLTVGLLPRSAGKSTSILPRLQPPVYYLAEIKNANEVSACIVLSVDSNK